MISFIIALAAYAVIMWGFNAGLGTILQKKILGNIQTVDIQAPKQEEETPPPPPPKVDVEPPPFVPPPDIVIQTAPVQNSSAIQEFTHKKPVEAPPPVRKPVTVAPAPDTRHGGITRPEYPPSVRRAGIEGTVYVQVYVLENGHVGDVRIQKSSGSDKLDEACINEAKRHWRFKPGTADGKVVPMWVTVPIVFKLTD